MRELKKLFDGNQAWIEKQSKKDPNYFIKLSKVQKPKYLWIGCSDSRVPANEILGLDAGKLFVHRNIGNLFLHADMNALSVLEYAVDILHIKHVIVCGHYGCGAIRSSMDVQRKGVIDHWLRNVRDIYVRNKKELHAMHSIEKKIDRLVELNIKQQVLNICHTSIVQQAWLRNQPLCIHGWVYDLKTGKLIDLNSCFSSIDQVDEVYYV